MLAPRPLTLARAGRSGSGIVGPPPLDVPGPETSHFSKRLDTTMLVHLGGRERTEAEYAALLGRADWELLERWDPERGPMSALEARKQ